MLLLLLAACHDADLTYTLDCQPAPLDTTVHGTDLSSELDALRGAAPELTLDWNRSNAVGAADDAARFEGVAFLVSEAEVCERSDTVGPVEATAPVSFTLRSDGWLGEAAIEGVLTIAQTGQIALVGETFVALPSELLGAAADLVSDAMGVAVGEEEVPTEALLTVSTPGGASGSAALEYTRDQTVAFADPDEPEPVGAEVSLAVTAH